MEKSENTIRPSRKNEAFLKGMPPSVLLDETAFAEAQKELTKRPTMNIRAKIILGFAMLFLLCAVTSITFLIIGHRVSQKLKVMETVNSYAFEIQQARRFEKNFFLYQTNLPDALENVQNAREIIKKESGDILEAIGRENLSTMTDHINRYESLLTKLRVLPSDQAERAEYLGRIEGELRQHGAEMIFMAATLLDKERKEVEAMTKLSSQVPFIFLAVLLIIMVYLTRFLAQQIVRPLNRFVNYSLRIAQGDFTPIKPAKRYKDEFSKLAVAINWMMDQLQKNQEQLIQSRKMASIGTLTSGIAHELNNPLNNICITAESLIDDFESIPDSEKTKRIRDIYTQAERASGTVRNLLDFTRMGQPAFVSLSAHEVLRSVLNLARNEMELNNVELSYSPDESPEARMEGDFSQLQQCFLNLVINAIQAMPRGGKLGLHVSTDDSEFVRVDIEDTGVGIPQSVIGQIFDPFFTTKEKGTGLGLSTSYSIAKKHGGKILVESQINQGSAFSVFIPKSKE
jgi:two-component system NtrC family sensor kinase